MGLFDKLTEMVKGKEVVFEIDEEAEWNREESVLEEIGECDDVVTCRDKALEIVRSISEYEKRSIALSQIAFELAKAEKPHEGIFEEALETARSIRKSTFVGNRSRALAHIASDLAQIGEPYQHIFEEALEDAESIVTEDTRSTALEEIVSCLAIAGEFEVALDITKDDIGDTSPFWKKNTAFGNIASELAKAGKFEEALEIAGDIPYENICIGALRNIALELVKAGKFEEALEITESIVRSVAGSENGGWNSSIALARIGSELAKAENPYKHLFEAALETARNISSKGNRSQALSNIASALARAGEFEEALKTARIISDESHRSHALARIASELAKAEKPPYKHLFKESLELTRNISDEEYSNFMVPYHSFALRDIVLELAKAEEFEEALKTARKISDETAHSDAFVGISIGLVKASLKRSKTV